MAIFHIDSVKPSQATGDVKIVYDALKTEMGDVVEPIALHALIPELLKSNWGILREALIIEDQVKRKYKEAIASAISSLNDCPYCVDAHTIMLIGLNDKQTAKAVEKQDLDLVQDPKTKELLDWAYNTKYFQSEIIQEPPFSKEEAPEVIGTAVLFHYLNRMVTVFLGETILPFNISFLKSLMKKMAAFMFSKVLTSDKKANDSFEQLNMDEHGNPFYWASSNPRVQYVLSTFYNVVHQLGKKHVEPQVFDFIKKEIDSWTGSEHIDIADLGDKLVSVKSEYKNMAQMLYFIAFMPYRVTANLINEFRKTYQLSDDQILGMFSWASYMAATKISIEVGVPFKKEKNAN